jgi:hypothetical protein
MRLELLNVARLQAAAHLERLQLPRPVERYNGTTVGAVSAIIRDPLKTWSGGHHSSLKKKKVTRLGCILLDSPLFDIEREIGRDRLHLDVGAGTIVSSEKGKSQKMRKR